MGSSATSQFFDDMTSQSGNMTSQLGNMTSQSGRILPPTPKPRTRALPELPKVIDKIF